VIRVFLLFAFCLSWAAFADAPNFVFILTDDQGWSQVSHRAHPDMPESKSDYIETPNMSRIATEGMRFTRGYSPAPLCTPTRRSIVCGASAARSGSEFRSSYVPHEHMTMPKALKQANANYVAAHFGKWGEQMISTPEQCGYDLSDGMTGNVTGGMADKMKSHHVTEDPKRTDSVTDRAIDFIKKQKKAGKPFYAQVSYYAIHLRVELMEKSLKKYQAKGTPDRKYTPGWAGMLEEMDTAIGRILDTLDEQGIADNTYVVFMTDNGGRGIVPGAEHDAPPPNFPLKGAKHSLDEGGIRVPFYVRGPGVKANSWCHESVSGYDLLPTFYQLAGGTKGLPDEVDGGSFVHLIHGESKNPVKRGIDGLVFHRPRQKGSIYTVGDYKLFLKWQANGKPGSAVLYNTVKDPTEKTDLAAAQPERVAAMQKTLLRFLDSVDAETVASFPAKKKPRKKKK
jgi:arylsulfatase A-like enzyme